MSVGVGYDFVSRKRVLLLTCSMMEAAICCFRCRRTGCLWAGVCEMCSMRVVYWGNHSKNVHHPLWRERREEVSGPWNTALVLQPRKAQMAAKC